MCNFRDNSMTKILYVTNDAWFFVSHRLPIASAATQSGYDCVVTAKEDDSVSDIREAGIAFTSWNISPRGKSIWGEIKTFYDLVKTIRTEKPDIVHLVTIKAVLYGGLISRLLKVPCCVYAIAGLGSVLRSSNVRERSIKKIISPLYRLAIAHTNGVLIFQNPDDRSLLLKEFGGDHLNTEMIKGSGVNPSHFPLDPEPPGIPRVILASRLLREKGIGEFVSAAKILRERGASVNFIVAGGNVAAGAPGAFTEPEISAFENDTNVEFLGQCKNIPELFASSHIVVLPSYYPEGLPKVLVEAGASGRPIVTTDWPGCRDAIKDGETGILIPIKDPYALADAIERLLEDPALRLSMGKAGRDFVESELSLDRVVLKHLDIYEKLLIRNALRSQSNR